MVCDRRQWSFGLGGYVHDLGVSHWQRHSLDQSGCHVAPDIPWRTSLSQWTQRRRQASQLNLIIIHQLTYKEQLTYNLQLAAATLAF